MNSFKKSTKLCVKNLSFRISDLSEEFPQISRTRLFRIWHTRISWDKSMHSIFGLFLGLCIHDLNRRLVLGYDSVKFVHFFPLAQKERQSWAFSLSIANVNQMFWYPPCTKRVVTQSLCDSQWYLDLLYVLSFCGFLILILAELLGLLG